MGDTDLTADDQDYVSIDRWGHLSKQDLAQLGIDSLLGLLSAYHENCDSHFWCAPPPQVNVFVMADFYQATGNNGENYIGCYLRGADFDGDGVPTIHQTPSMKLLLQPLSNGQVCAAVGQVGPDEDGTSAGGLGMLDRTTAVNFLVTPRTVPDVPHDPSDFTTFVVQRMNNQWQIAYFYHGTEYPASSQVKVFAALPAYSQPSVLQVLNV